MKITWLFNIWICIFLLSIFNNLLFAQKIDFSTLPVRKIDDQVLLYFLKSDTLFNSKQQIFILMVPKSASDAYNIEIAYSDTLALTSQIAQEENAIAAINGSFFDMDRGGGSYLS